MGIVTQIMNGALPDFEFYGLVTLNMRSLSFLLVPVLAVTAYAATPEDQARAVIEQFSAATKAKDAEAVSRLLASDCIIIMTEPAAGARRGRFYTRESYLKLLRERFSQTTASISTQTVHTVSSSEAGDVFVIADSEERTRIGERSEWIRYHNYIVMRQASDNIMIHMVVAELAFYVPDVPPEPTREPNKK